METILPVMLIATPISAGLIVLFVFQLRRWAKKRIATLKETIATAKNDPIHFHGGFVAKAEEYVLRAEEAFGVDYVHLLAYLKHARINLDRARQEPKPNRHARRVARHGHGLVAHVVSADGDVHVVGGKGNGKRRQRRKK